MGTFVRFESLQEYLLIVGDEEVESGTVSVRQDGMQEGGRPFVSFIAEVKEKVLLRTADL